MRIKTPYIISICIILQIFLSPVVYAQTNASDKIRSVGNFFTSFFDLDNSTNYIRDTFVQNQCRKRDLFNIHAQKDELADSLLENYSTLTDEQIDKVKKQYSLLTGELTYVRNISENNTTAELKAIVINKIRPRIANFRQDIVAEVEVWNEKYQNRVEEYRECKNSWQAVKDQIDNIDENIKEIKSNWGSFKEQFNKTGQELLDTPGGLYRNTRDAVSDIPDSFTQTYENFYNEADRLIDELSGEEIDPTQTYDEEVERQMEQLASERSLAEILETERRLTVIPSILRQQREQNDIAVEAALDNTENIIAHSYTDDAAFVLWNDILQLNYNLQNINELMNNDSNGLIKLADELGDRQCSL